ncbi:hypothetical protein [Paraferrimonas sedimenticola]|uniref:Uncharacterized protein n=1 Tax=Paraferrimonas sedimenticola TaxID=375674 RepID=A0AA37W1Z4_9GAMM|nr:hypothetical protein [Paraferrimonas sedimenticola]GLP97062.1 hypothetical protein GCM10007895_23680 [Paraferrimonas sedimenticola]
MEVLFKALIIAAVLTYITYLMRQKFSLKQQVAQAMREGGTQHYPSWLSDIDKRKRFGDELIAATNLRDIPRFFTETLLATEASLDKLLATAGIVERTGASFEEQHKVVLDQVILFWESLRDEDKGRFR